MSLNKVRNYNLSYEMLLEASSQFEGFITGGGINNQLFNYGLAEDILDQRIGNSTDTVNQEERLVLKEIGPRILDRTSGTFFLNDIIKNPAKKVTNASPPDRLDRYMKIVYEYVGANLGNSLAINADDIYNDTVASGAHKDLRKAASVREMIAPFKLEDMTIPPSEKEESKDEKKDDDGNYISTLVSGPKSLDIPHVNQAPANKSNRFESPNLGAIVVKHPKLNMGGRNANHLSVFFNAVPPIEMSRCTPYINIIVMHESFEKNNIPKLNNVSYMRFIKNNDGFVLDDGIGLTDAKPLHGVEQDFYGYKDNSIVTRHSFMDIFTSPQTLANANINSAGSFDWSRKEEFGDAYNTSPVLEPITPFLSLKGLDISITGKGFGIMSSKVAKLSMTLHDRSRLKDLAPLLATNKLAFTKLFIEYGWSHPEGDPLADNAIGRYLNALRDIGYYSVRASSYSFNDGQVDIDVSLVCTGFDQLKTVTAAAGIEVPMALFSDYIDMSIAEFDKKIKGTAGIGKDAIPELRQKIKINQRAARSPLATISYGDFIDFVTAKKSNDKKKLINSLSRLMGLTLPGEIKSEKEIASLIDKNIPVKMGQKSSSLLLAKLYAMNKNRTIDPFGTCFVHDFIMTKAIVDGKMAGIQIKESDMKRAALNLSKKVQFEEAANAHYVTLGKILMSFVGHPMAVTGLYDEVQMVFYPLNHQAGAARRHTTASMPIEYDRLQKVITDSLKSTQSLTASGVFSLIESKILNDRNIAAYGLQTVFSELKEYQDLDKPDQIKLAKADYPNAGSDEKSVQLKINALRGKVKGSLTDVCKEIYSADGIEALTEPVFVRPNISLYFETIPVVDPVSFDNAGGYGSQLLGLIGIQDQKDKAMSSGLIEGASILRIHVFDEEAVSSPSAISISNILTEGYTGKLLMNAGNPKYASLVESANIKGGLAKFFDKKGSFSEIKQFVKRQYPSITYGASTSTIKSINISSNVSGDLKNVLMVEAYNSRKKAQTGQGDDSQFEEVIMFPSAVSISMMGMPMIARGENIFIDFNTDTSLDNIYYVKMITHSLKSGEFTTNVELNASNQGAVGAFKDKLKNATTALIQGK